MTRSWPALDLSPVSDPDLLQGALADYDIVAIDDNDDDRWRVYFSNTTERDRAATALPARFPGLSVRSIDVADEDWAARSQATLRAIHAGKIIVAPPWDAPIVIVIKPSMGFGTGHHATTRLCLEALQHVELTGRTVLDAGTGSGVLAIAASLLGAAEVTAIDDDADAVRAAWENLALNTGAVVSLLVGDVRKTDLRPAEVVIANLTGAMLMASADRLGDLVVLQGRLIVSGLLSSEEAGVVGAYPDFLVERRAEEENWVCLTLFKRSPSPSALKPS